MTKSKPRSASLNPLEALVFFIDECLGKALGEALRAAGYDVRTWHEEGLGGTPDVQWLPQISHRVTVLACLGLCCGDPSSAQVPLPIYGVGQGGPGVEQARSQAVLHFELGGASDVAACGGARRISRPEGALATLVSESGVGTRVVDGEGASVACLVAEAGAAESGAEVAEEPLLGFDVDLLLDSGDGRWRIVGRVANAEESTVRVEMQDVLRGSLVAQCEVVAETVLRVAAWLRGWQCPEVVLDGRPPIECSGDGGVILENCGR